MRMSESNRVKINLIPTGIPGLDTLLGGGIVEYSFNLIAGAPGAGKTTAAQQFLFTNATEARPAVYFTVLGEPQLKMLRYQQQFSFFDNAKFGDTIRFHNLSDLVLKGDLETVLEEITAEVERSRPAYVVVDSFRSVIRTTHGQPLHESALQSFLQHLALRLTSWEVTIFLIGEYMSDEIRENPVFTVADGIFWFSQSIEQNSVVRKLQVIKSRGQAPIPGLHTFRITDDGMKVFPRTMQHARDESRATSSERYATRQSTGVPELDQMLGGGIPTGDSVLIAGPAGSGKTVLGAQFVAASLEAGEAAVVACFEEQPEPYVRRAELLGIPLARLVESGRVRIIYMPLLDLSVDEALQGIRDAVEEIGASRVVIDSLSGFEVALAPSFREEFREALYRMLAALGGAGVTVIMTVEVSDDYGQLRFSPHAVSFLIDDLILQRYIELDGGIRRVLTVVKMRGSAHDTSWRAYEIARGGIAVGEVLDEYRGIITGVPVPRDAPSPVFHSRLTSAEMAIMDAVRASGESTADRIVQNASLDLGSVRSSLDRLVLLGYLVAADRPDGPVYRAPDTPGE
jgi:circadian clock protein KaiC